MQGKITTGGKVIELLKMWEKIWYLRIRVTNQNLIHEEIKSGLNSGNVCYHSAQNLLYSRLLPKNVKIKLHKNVILILDMCRREIWSLALKEGHRLKGLENRVLRRIFGPKRYEIIGE
jgi:hypothetical protein